MITKIILGSYNITKSYIYLINGLSDVLVRECETEKQVILNKIYLPRNSKKVIIQKNKYALHFVTVASNIQTNCYPNYDALNLTRQKQNQHGGPAIDLITVFDTILTSR